MATTLLSSWAFLETELKTVKRMLGLSDEADAVQLLAGSIGVRETLRRLPVEAGEDE